MAPGIWTASIAHERIEDLRREAGHERLIRWLRHGRKARHGGWVHRHGWAGGIRAARLRRQPGPSRPGPRFLTQRDERS